jgi:alkylation response protein AidB-like acyl-CoA dehydrogenase
MAPLEAWGTAYRGPLYRLTIWPPVALLAPPALGIARAAIDGVIELAATKTPSFTASALRERQVVQRQVAEAEAHLGAARAYLYGTFEDAWRAAVDGAPIDLHRKAQLQLASTHAVASAARAVDLAYAAAGSSAVRNELPWQRHFRDVHTITQHAFVSAQRYESVGALLLGAPSDWGFFAS